MAGSDRWNEEKQNNKIKPGGGESSQCGVCRSNLYQTT